jgi:hypothetical protein
MDRLPPTPRRPDGSPWPAAEVDGRSGLGPVGDEIGVLENVVRRELAAASIDLEDVKANMARQELIRRGEGTNYPRKIKLYRDGVPGTDGIQPRMYQLVPPVEA